MSTFPETSLTDDLTSVECNLLINLPPLYTLNFDFLIDPRHERNQNQDSRPPRPPNSWIIFRRMFESRLQSQQSDPFRMAGEDWKSQPKSALQWHNKTYPDNKPVRKKKNNWYYKR
ncbi:5308_t:CDS:1 [Paraglomus brasilianum]|uniref:5308_t:CDS:1 n=1 Tax=Paraglomus brasilianum TaxID=144538 RepID=A0A9N9AFE9_9GLOM|nr:5308_t:CDS:1 [Paraglomus brasilianum]